MNLKALQTFTLDVNYTYDYFFPCPKICIKWGHLQGPVQLTLDILANYKYVDYW